jgi:hypothetical protein
MDAISNDFSQLSVGDLHASSHNNTPALSRISLERDVFTDDEHKLLDAKISQAFSAFQEINREPVLSYLLSQITMDKRLTTLTPDEAEELLKNEPSISNMLRNAWQAGSFKEVRRLGAFLFILSRANS